MCVREREINKRSRKNRGEEDTEEKRQTKRQREIQTGTGQ